MSLESLQNIKKKNDAIDDNLEGDLNVDENGHTRKTQMLADGTMAFRSNEEVAQFNKEHRESLK